MQNNANPVIEKQTSPVEVELSKSQILALRGLRTKVFHARGTRKLQMILDAEDSRALVQSMPAQELLFTVKDIGLADSGELLLLASREQITSCLDLDCWEKDKPKPEMLEQWLQTLAIEEFDVAERVLQALDSELMVLFFRELLVIHECKEGEMPTEEERKSLEGDLVEMPDRFYVIEIPFEADDPRAVLARSALKLFRLYGYEFTHKLFESIRWSLPSELQELSYQFRKARLMDLGFLDYYDAIGIFQALPPKAQAMPPSIAVEQELLPVLSMPRARGIFGDGMAQIKDTQQRERLQFELMYVTNKVICAEQVDPSNLNAISKVMRMVQRTIDIGLEALGAQDGPGAAQLLRAHHIEWLFRNGYSAMLRLRKQANRLRKDERLGLEKDAEPSLLPAGQQGLLTALMQTRPRFHTMLDDPPGEVTRPFRSLHDIQRAQEGLNFIAFLPEFFFQHLPFRWEDLREMAQTHEALEEFDFVQLFLTSLAHFCLYQSFELRALNVEEIKSFHHQAFSYNQNKPPYPLDETLQSKVHEALRALFDPDAKEQTYLSLFLDLVWQRLQDEAAYIPPDQDLDARFLNLFLLNQGTHLQA